jgi:hypothetical protein
MTDRSVVLRKDDALVFVADACAALADAINEIRASRTGDTNLTAAYAEMVVAYSRLLRDQLSDARHGPANLAIVDHLAERLRQAQNNEITTPVLDIVDRLHGELTREPAGV